MIKEARKKGKDDPIQKTINNFFAIQLRRLSRENNKANTKSTKGTGKSSKAGNKRNTDWRII